MDTGLLARLEHALLSNRLARSLLFNDLTGTFAEYLEAARRRHRYREYREQYDVHPGFEFRGPGIELYGTGSIELERDSYIGHHSRIQSKGDATVRIGENTAVSHYVFLYTENRVADQDMSRARNRNYWLDVSRGDVTVASHCWVGAFTFLTEGTTVGENTVVGAHSVVTDDLPPHCIAAGTPARVRRFKSYLDEDRKQSLAREYADVLSADLADRLGVADRAVSETD